MAIPSINVNHPEVLSSRLKGLESKVIRKALASGSEGRVESKLRINGAEVSFTVTPSVQPGRIYRLFRVNGKKVAKAQIPAKLLPNVP